MASSEHRRLSVAVHAAASAHGIDDTVYREMMRTMFGRVSSKDCTEAELRRLLVRLNGGGTGRSFRVSKRPEIRKIFAQWGELKRKGVLDNPTPAGLRAFCARMANLPAGVTKDPDHLTAAEARVVIEALKAWIERAG